MIAFREGCRRFHRDAISFIGIHHFPLGCWNVNTSKKARHFPRARTGKEVAALSWRVNVTGQHDVSTPRGRIGGVHPVRISEN